MIHRLAALLTISLALAFAPLWPARAGEITEVADAADGDDPFDFELEVGWRRTLQQAKFTRENLQIDSGTGAPDIVDVTELRYRDLRNELLITARAGIFHDLEIHGALPIVFSDEQEIWPAQPLLDAGIQNTTLENRDGVCSNGTIDPSCVERLVEYDTASGENNSYRGGLGDGHIGFTWGLMNDERDAWSPRWNIGADWTFPSGGKRKPTAVSHDPNNPMPVGEKTNYFTFHTALSKDLGRADPYFKLYYRLPFATPEQSFHNCESPDSLADMDVTTPGVQNTCSVGTEWLAAGNNRGGLRPSHVGGVTFGTELLPYIDAKQGVRIALDLQVDTSYHSEGRVFSELSDFLGRTTYIGDFIRFDGTVGLRVRASKYAQFHLLTTFGYDSEHFLTDEPIGRNLKLCINASTGLITDQTSTCSVVNDSIELTRDQVNPEMNPNYDFRWDQPGRRFRIEEISRFGLFIGGEIDF